MNKIYDSSINNNKSNTHLINLQMILYALLSIYS